MMVDNCKFINLLTYRWFINLVSQWEVLKEIAFGFSVETGIQPTEIRWFQTQECFGLVI